MSTRRRIEVVADAVGFTVVAAGLGFAGGTGEGAVVFGVGAALVVLAAGSAGMRHVQEEAARAEGFAAGHADARRILLERFAKPLEPIDDEIGIAKPSQPREGGKT